MDLKLGGIVLAGGQSRRMGRAKATLPFGPETMVERIVRVVGEVCSPIVVVAAAGQELPRLNPAVIVVRDSQPDCGPLEGMASGLRQLTAVDAVFLTGCDTPLLRSAFVFRIAKMLDQDHEAVVPVINDLPQPLAGVYRPSVRAEVEAMLASGQRRMFDLPRRIVVLQVDANRFRDIDPLLGSLRNVNTPDEYRAALAAAGLANQNPK
jgi:molybdenum cofactor guanylyltransferase